MSSEKKGEHDETQKKAFTKWFNAKLKKGGRPLIENCLTDFESGLRLMDIANVLYNVPLPPQYKKDPPKLKIKVIAEYINYGLDMLKNKKKEDAKGSFKHSDRAQNFKGAGVEGITCSGENIYDHDTRQILGMMWRIILDYAINGISEGGESARNGLLLWAKKKTAGYKGVDPPSIDNFTTHWRSGLAFCALIHRHRPDLLDYSTLDPRDAAGNLKLAFDLAENQCGIPRILDVEDVNVERPDEKSVMAQVAEYYHAFAKLGDKELKARRALNFLEFQMRMKERQDAYIRRATELVEWQNGSLEQWLANTDDLQAAFEAQSLDDNTQKANELKVFISEVQPKRLVDRIDLSMEFAQIRTDLRLKQRADFLPPQGLAPENLGEGEARLTQAESRFAAALQVKRMTFANTVKPGLDEAKQKEIEESFKAFDKDGSGALDLEEFKAALVTLSIPYDGDAGALAEFKEATRGDKVTKEEFMVYMVNRLADQDNSKAITDAFAKLAGGTTITAAQLRACPPITPEAVDWLKGVTGADENDPIDFAPFISAQYAPEEKTPE